MPPVFRRRAGRQEAAGALAVGRLPHHAVEHLRAAVLAQGLRHPRRLDVYGQPCLDVFWLADSTSGRRPSLYVYSQPCLDVCGWHLRRLDAGLV